MWSSSSSASRSLQGERWCRWWRSTWRIPPSVAAAIAILTGVVVMIPLLGGTYVADTIAGKLVPFTGPENPAPLAHAVIASVAVVLVLSRRGLPPA
jgi:hypothetical protein